MVKNNKITAKDVLEALKAKHSEDIFVPECKTGSSWCGKYQSLDAWVMPKSWSKMNILGYEIKVSRSDFLNDHKWENYMGYCNSMYFVCPPKLIQPEELPDNVGLMWTSTNCTRLYTKRKAVKRDIDIPIEIFQYILMWRTVITGERSISQKDYYLDWLKEKHEKKELGVRVSRRVRELYDKDVIEVEKENKKLKNKMEGYDEIVKIMQELDIDTDYIYSLKRDFREKIEELKKGFDEEFMRKLKWLKSAIVDFEEKYNC